VVVLTEGEGLIWPELHARATSDPKTVASTCLRYHDLGQWSILDTHGVIQSEIDLRSPDLDSEPLESCFRYTLRGDDSGYCGRHITVAWTI
jgi:hypothetical protein